MLFSQTATLIDGTTVKRAATARHMLDFYRAVGLQGDVLFVTFENRATPRDNDDRLPWAFAFLKAEGYSVLGVKSQGKDWYRDPELFALFAGDDMRMLLAGFRRVVFYGGSMGGCGALTLVNSGATVLVISPQVSLDPALTPWETRYDEGRGLDWSGPWTAQASAARAERIYCLYDPFIELDVRHVRLLPTGNLQPLRLPFLDHGIPDWILQTGLLKRLVTAVAEDRLTLNAWPRLARLRRETPDYAARMAAARPTPCVRQLCQREELRVLQRLVAAQPQHIPLNIRYVKALGAAGFISEAIAHGEWVELQLAAIKARL